MKIRGLIFSIFFILVQSTCCNAYVDISTTPEKISEECRGFLAGLGAQFGKFNLRLYCPLSESQILTDSERLYKVVSKFLDDHIDVDPSKFDEVCRSYIANNHRDPSFDGKIRVVSVEEFKKYVDNPDYVQLYRGVTPEGSADLRAGNIFVGGAVRGPYYPDNSATSGNGMYFTTEYKHAKMWADAGFGDVVTGVIDKKNLECISSSYLSKLFDLMIKNHINDREDFKEYSKNIGDMPSGREYAVNSSAFKKEAELVKKMAGFDYFSDESKKLNPEKRMEEYEKTIDNVEKNETQARLNIVKETYKQLYGTDKVEEMLPVNLNNLEFLNKCEEKIAQNSGGNCGFSAQKLKLKTEIGKDSYLLDKVYAMSRNPGLLAKLFGFDACCDEGGGRGNYNPNNATSSTTKGTTSNEELLLFQKMSDADKSKRIKSKEETADYYDFKGDEINLVNFDDLIVCAEKFEPSKKTGN